MNVLSYLLNKKIYPKKIIVNTSQAINIIRDFYTEQALRPFLSKGLKGWCLAYYNTSDGQQKKCLVVWYD